MVAKVVLLVVRDLAVPHDKDDLQPFRPERPERLMMRVARARCWS